MKKQIYFLIAIITQFGILANAQTFNKRASMVLGQKSFSEGKLNQGASTGPGTLKNPNQILWSKGKFLICDGENNRVLIYNSFPTQIGQNADLVIGQKDLFSSGIPPVGPDMLDRPSGLDTDGKRLFILDRDNHRILIYHDIPKINGDSADFVIGQNDFYDRSWGGEQEFDDTLNMSEYKFSSGPTGICYDSASGKLIVFDSDNNRLMIFNDVPDSNGTPASIVVGQNRFTTNKANQGGAPSANSLYLSTATGVLVYKGKLIVTDRLNHRVLIYNKIPEVNNQAADVVIGQDNFSTNAKNKGGTIGSCGMDGPRAAAVDEDGKLYIAEAGNARILVFDSIPTVNGQCANSVIGQESFNTGAGSTTDSTFNTFISFVAFVNNKMVVSDQGNHRILIFDKVGIPIGVHENSIFKKVSVYPNPICEEYFDIKLNQYDIDIKQFKLIDMVGKEIPISQETIGLNIYRCKFVNTGLEAGIYNLVIYHSNFNFEYNIKIVKQK
ncbi:MAG: NHL repeat-containing protein [Bacteroidetes bacterium]|nr:NHL repeat-containing protein [Bacteroidota bacterium]